MTATPVMDIAALERRRRLSLRWAVGMLVMAVVAFPLGLAIGGHDGSSETEDTIGGAFLMAAIIGLIAAPWIVRAWQSHMRRRMVAAVVTGRPDIQHVDGEQQATDARAALSSPAFVLGAFRDCGLVEAFEAATVQHVLMGDAGGVPFALAELALLDAKRYRMFGGVLASFRLERARAGLTVVTRDQGAVGNLLARAGTGIERITLEDPRFEDRFEVYGDDQLEGRVVLTPAMLQRLQDLDELGHARGFACAFRGSHLLVAFTGMTWRCPPWRILRPLDGWLHGYAAWLTGLVDLPRGIVAALNLDAPDLGIALTPVTREPLAAVAVTAGEPDVFSSSLFRLIGEGGMAAAYVMSGAVFGGLALVSARYGLTEGYSEALFYTLWGLTLAGLAYGAFAVGLGVSLLGKLVWKWKSPLRTLQRPRR